jgi:protein TonB
MRDLLKWLGLSLGIHLVVLGFLAFFATLQPKNIRPVVIDLTLADFPATVAQPSAKRESTRAAARVALPEVRKQVLKREPAEKVKQPTVAAVESPLPQALPVAQKNVPDAVQAPGVMIGSAERGASGDLGTSPEVPSAGNKQPSSGNESQRYLAEHFRYIRDLVRKHLVYPAMAQKMGWDGKAVVAFVIMENGSVDNIRLVESSGIPLLDRSALETIRRASPFPRPPVKAEIVIPVLFKLR